MKERIAELIFL